MPNRHLTQDLLEQLNKRIDAHQEKYARKGAKEHLHEANFLRQICSALNGFTYDEGFKAGYDAGYEAGVTD